LKWAVNDALSVSPSFYYQELHINDTAVLLAEPVEPGTRRVPQRQPLPNPSTDPFWLAAIKVDWDLGFGQLTSNTSYYSSATSIRPRTTRSICAPLFSAIPIRALSGADGWLCAFRTSSNFYQEFAWPRRIPPPASSGTRACSMPT
jgi:hypothetical protein